MCGCNIPVKHKTTYKYSKLIVILQKKIKTLLSLITHTLFWFYKAHCQNGFNKAIKIGHISPARI